VARNKPSVALYSLSHVIDQEWMREAYRLTRKSGAPGIDGVVAAEYESNLERNLQDLLGRILSGSYRLPFEAAFFLPYEPARYLWRVL
jgi:RNA-directed DNA polymerase